MLKLSDQYICPDHVTHVVVDCPDTPKVCVHFTSGSNIGLSGADAQLVLDQIDPPVKDAKKPVAASTTPAK